MNTFYILYRNKREISIFKVNSYLLCALKGIVKL